jgi:hypothetical protein
MDGVIKDAKVGFIGEFGSFCALLRPLLSLFGDTGLLTHPSRRLLAVETPGRHPWRRCSRIFMRAEK